MRPRASAADQQKKKRASRSWRGRRVRKPGSVSTVGRPSVADDHSSRTRVTAGLQQPTLGLGRAALERPYTWSCSGWGLPCHDRCRSRGGLLPHRFTLTRRRATGGLFSVALSSRFPSPGVTRHPALWSPDFPPRRSRARAIVCTASTGRNLTQDAGLGQGQAAALSNTSRESWAERLISVMRWRNLRFARSSSCRARSRETPRRRPISASDSSSSESASRRFSTM